MTNYKDLIIKNNGIIYANNLKEYGITRHDLRNMIAQGLLERLIHGIYVSPEKNVNEFWLMNEKYKNGIYSHNTALYFYGLTDRTPIKLDMTFPDNNRVNNEYLKVHYIKKDNHKLGLTTIKIEDGYEVRVYNVERTMVKVQKG